MTSAFQKIKSNADAAISAAKSDFPSKTKALTSAIDALSKSVQQLSTSPATAIAAIPGESSDTATAVQNFSNATKSKCS